MFFKFEANMSSASIGLGEYQIQLHVIGSLVLRQVCRQSCKHPVMLKD